MAVGNRIKLAGVTAELFDQVEAAVDARGSRPAGTGPPELARG